jgi:hypothetical protein
MAKLVKSLRDFPEMLELREVVVDEGLMVLGGNMRVLALREIGATECRAKIVTGLSPEQKKEFVIKDNGFFGVWDYDALANAWSGLPLIEWGISIPEIDTPVLSDIDFMESKKKTGKFTYLEEQEIIVKEKLRTIEGEVDGFRFYI